MARTRPRKPRGTDRERTEPARGGPTAEALGPGPIRTCCGCGARDRQALLLRLAVGPSGHVVADPERRRGGRGTYVHRQGRCWEGFVRGRPYLRSLRRTVSRGERATLVAALRRAPETAAYGDGDTKDPLAGARSGTGEA